MSVFNVWLLLLLIVLFPTHDEGYVFQCPHHAQWNLRAEIICNVAEKYYCLFDDNNKKYFEFCKDSYEFEKPGYKLIVVGSLNREMCHTNRYQPIQFWSNGSSDCIFSKSTCNEEGQIILNNGTSAVDRACSCDYAKGYDFVNTPKQKCFVTPSDEDCSCYLKLCDTAQILTPDYRCVNITEWAPPFSCSIKTVFRLPENILPDQKKALETFTTTGNFLEFHNYRRDCVFVLYAVISVFIALGSFVLVLHEHLTRDAVTKETNTITTKRNSVSEDNNIEINTNIQTSRDRKTKHLAYFVPTRASENILNGVKEHQCALITGPPGSGKTTIAYHIAFELEKSDGYKVETVVMPGEILKIINSSVFDGKYVFVIDDVIGNTTICNCNFEKIRDAIKTALQKNSIIKIIMTCRSHVYQMNDFYDKMFHHCDLLLSSMQLSVHERRTMIKRYLGDDVKLEIEDNVLMLYNFFPALCAMAVREKENLLDFLNYPFAFIDNEVSRNREHSDVVYLALAIIVVANNKVEKSVFYIQDESGDSILHDICGESRFKQLPIKGLLYTTLESLKGTYIVEDSTSFSLLNNKLFDIISSLVGKSFIKSILQYGHTTFISTRMQLASIEESFDQFTILVPVQFEDLYFSRKLKDINKGVVRDSLCNRQMQFSRYRTKFFGFLKNNQKVIMQAKDIKDGSSVLHVIAFLGYQDLFSDFLKNNKANINKTVDKEKRTALHVACSQPNNSEIVKLLVSYKAKVNCQDSNGWTALHVACLQGLYDIILTLLENAAKTNIADKAKITPLHVACMNNCQDIATVLINSKADVNAKDKDGWTPLFFSCKSGNRALIKFLIEHGADTNIRDKKKMLASTVALESGFPDVLELFKYERT